MQAHPSDKSMSARPLTNESDRKMPACCDKRALCHWYYIFPFCPSASAFPSRYRNAMAGTRKIGTWVSCFAMPKSSNCFVMRNALVTFALSSLQSSTMASVAGIWELLRYFTSQRIFSRGSSMTTSTSF